MRSSHTSLASLAIGLCVACASSARVEAPVLTPKLSLDTRQVSDGVMYFSLSVIPPKDSVARAVGDRTVACTIERHGSQRLLHVVSTVHSYGRTIIDSIVTDLDGVRPISERSIQPTHTMSLNFNGAVVTGSVVPKSGAPIVINQTLSRPTFNSSDVDLVLASLPFDRSYTGELPLYTYEAGGIERYVVDSIRQDVSQKVSQPAWVSYATGPVIQLRVWSDAKTRRLLRHEAFYKANGALSIAVLDSVRVR